MGCADGRRCGRTDGGRSAGGCPCVCGTIVCQYAHVHVHAHECQFKRCSPVFGRPGLYVGLNTTRPSPCRCAATGTLGGRHTIKTFHGRTMPLKTKTKNVNMNEQPRMKRGPSKGEAHAHQGLEEQANEQVRLLARPTRTASTRHEGSGNLRCTAQLIASGRAHRPGLAFCCAIQGQEYTRRAAHRVFVTACLSRYQLRTIQAAVHQVTGKWDTPWPQLRSIFQ